jgi:hypothetical protein
VTFCAAFNLSKTPGTLFCFASKTYLIIHEVLRIQFFKIKLFRMSDAGFVLFVIATLVAYFLHHFYKPASHNNHSNSNSNNNQQQNQSRSVEKYSNKINQSGSVKKITKSYGKSGLQ